MNEQDNDHATPGQWERGLLQNLVLGTLNEQRRARRWNMLFRLLILLYLFVVLWLWWPDSLSGLTKADEGHTALIDLKGVIAADESASANRIIKHLRAAFEDDDTQAVILRINSPGGSPVQSREIYKEIQRLRSEHEAIPLYAVISDLCASGGYYVASAADKIYADQGSLVGSIGVLMNGFGFVDTLGKLGIERRLLTAGEHKGFLDPFSPLNAGEVEHTRKLLDALHQQFIAAVRAGRGDRLGEHPDLFSGLIWTGEQAKEMGLIDDFGSASEVARKVVGAEELKKFGRDRDLLERFADRVGASIARQLPRIGQGEALPQLR